MSKNCSIRTQITTKKDVKFKEGKPELKITLKKHFYP